MSFTRKIETWYEENARRLPWRETKDPYKIWLSEIILQQTRIEQGMGYYLRFVERFPTVADLAGAEEQEVMKLWQGLGYYSRARNLHAAAKSIVEQHGGVFPSTYEDILQLKGVGRYTAAAIASFAFRIPRPVIDGNVYRLVARIYGVYTPINTTAAYNEFEKILLGVMDGDRPDVFNQAMMDFGSTYCKPTGCDCDRCIFAQECLAHREGKVGLLPVKAAKVAVKERFLYYLDIQWEEGGERYTLMHRREGSDIWKGLYEFPVREQERPLTEEEVAQMVGKECGEVEWLREHPKVVHKLTHRTINAMFVEVKIGKRPTSNFENERVFAVEEIKKLPYSRLIDRYLNKK